MKTVFMCRSDEFCPYCKETGGEDYRAPAQYHCMTPEERCIYPHINCLFAQHGGWQEGRDKP